MSPSGVEAAARSTSAWIASRRRAASGRPAPDVPKLLDRLRPRGRTATHAITLECVKCRRGPRTSQMPSSGSIPGALEEVEQRPLQRPRRARPGARPCVARVVHARPSPRRRRRAGTARRRRCRCAPAASPRSPAASRARAPARRRSPAQPYMICSRDGSPATARSSQSRHAAGLLAIAAGEQRVERERRVAQPAVAVVPVAHAAELLGQRGRRRGDDAAGRRVGERLERDQRALDRVAPGRSRSQRADQSRHQASVSATAVGRVDGRRRAARATGTRSARTGPASPSSTANSARVVRSSPARRDRRVEPQASGPAIDEQRARRAGAPTGRGRSRSAAISSIAHSTRAARAPRRAARRPAPRRAAACSRRADRAVRGLELGLEHERVRRGSGARRASRAPAGAIRQRPLLARRRAAPRSSAASRSAAGTASRSSRRGRRARRVCVSPMRA